MSEDKRDTLYDHETECTDCGAVFTAPVELHHRESENDVVFAANGRCPDCRKGRIPFYRIVDIEDAYLTWANRLRALVQDPVPDTAPQPAHGDRDSA